MAIGSLGLFLATMLGVLSCAKPPRSASPPRQVPQAVARPECRTPAQTTADLTCYRQPVSGLMLVIDGSAAMLDTGASSRTHRDSLLAALAGRVITRIELYPARDSLTISQFGSRAVNGVLVLETRPF